MDISKQVVQDDVKSFNQFVNSFFETESKRVRFKKEIGMLMNQIDPDLIKIDLEESALQLSIVLYYSSTFFKIPELNTINEIVFEITVNKEYPIKGVKLYCKSSIIKPTISDMRDLLLDVLEFKWNNLTQFVEIYKKIPQFLTQLFQKKLDFLYIQKLGKYYLGQIYNLQDLKLLSDILLIACVQYEQNFFSKLYVRLIVITDCHFLMFDVDEKDEEMCKLTFWADLQSLVKINRKKDMKNKISLTWKNYQSNIQIIQTFQIKESEILIHTILKKIQPFQKLKIRSNSYLNYGKKWGSQKSKIEEIQNFIEKYEIEIKRKFNIETVEELIKYYNLAIEHYSAANDYLYNIYLNNLQYLLNRQDVQVLLNFKKDIKQQLKRSASQEVQEELKNNQETQNSNDSTKQEINSNNSMQQLISSSEILSEFNQSIIQNNSEINQQQQNQQPEQSFDSNIKINQIDNQDAVQEQIIQTQEEDFKQARNDTSNNEQVKDQLSGANIIVEKQEQIEKQEEDSQNNQ